MPNPDGETNRGGERLRVPTTALSAGTHVLSDEATRYVTRVHRKRPGDVIELFDPQSGTYASAVVGTLQRRALQCEVSEVRVGLRCGCAGLHLVQGLGKGDKPERVVRDAVALGAACVTLVQSLRSVARADGANDHKRERLVRIAVEAARQCARSNIPSLDVTSDWSQVHARYSREFGVVLQPQVAAPSIEAVLDSASPAPTAVVVYVGPEGGFDDREVAELTSRGALPASLGELVLRSELAAVVALARIGAVLTRG